MSTSKEIKTSITETAPGAGALFTIDPKAVVRDATMTIEEKRLTLASLASDARQAPDRPALRRLDNSCFVKINDVLDALKQLDCLSGQLAPGGKKAWPRRKRNGSRLRPTLGRRRSDDDDDPPTPVPAAIQPRPPVLEGGAAAAVPVTA